MFIEPGQRLEIPPAWTGEVVLKPAVSASAMDTGRYLIDSPEAAGLVARLHRDNKTVMAQPYQSAIGTYGETSLVYLGGRFSHAVHRPPLLSQRGPVTSQSAVPHKYSAAAPTPAQVNVAEHALRSVPAGSADLTYARVDLIPDGDGEPRLSELELIEPELFLRLASATAVADFASSVVSQARVR